MKIARGCQTAERNENIITNNGGNIIKSNGQYDCTSTSTYVFILSCVAFLLRDGKGRCNGSAAGSKGAFLRILSHTGSKGHI